jgi:DNA-binding transcriptional LysR family regulator
MEMHQIRYFLAVARNLNFTRAAEECNVSQPALTRAIKLLEDEFGGDLFRRERNLSHLTDLGQRMLPLVQQCYESALGAVNLAKAVKRGDVASLRLALSRSIDMELLTPFLSELLRAMNGLELKFVRGTVGEVAEIMKQGDADLAIAASITDSWDRFDARPLFTEDFLLLVPASHRLAGQSSITIADLQGERMLARTYCEMAGHVASRLKGERIESPPSHEVASERDLLTLLEGNFGVAIVPSSTFVPVSIRRVPLPELQVQRTVSLYAVAGRPRSGAASTFSKQLQAADWSRQP